MTSVDMSVFASEINEIEETVSKITEIEEIESEKEVSVEEDITIIDALQDYKENGVEALGDTNDTESKKSGVSKSEESADNDIVETLQTEENEKSGNETANSYTGEEDDEVDFDEDENNSSDETASTYKKKGKRNYNVKLSGDVRARIVQYANSLGGYFESPYIRGGMALAWQCCAYVNQVWWDVFGVDLYSISDSSKNMFSKDGESAYEFFERVGVKSGDVIYTRYQKIKKNKRGGVMRDKNGEPVKTMGQHFVVVLDYDEDYIWYTDGYESRTRGFVVSSIDKKIKYSESKYFRNVSGAFADIDGAYYSKAGKSGTRFRYYRLPEYVWYRAGGDNSVAKRDSALGTGNSNLSTDDVKKSAAVNRLSSMAILSATESTEVIGGVNDLWIAGLDNDGYEYNGSEITPKVEVYDNFKLIDEEEYVVEYTDNVDAGNATVWVSKITEPVGTISANFVIRPYDLEAHYNNENPEESDVAVKMPSAIKLGDLNGVKPLVTCTVSDNNVSESGFDEDESADDNSADTDENVADVVADVDEITRGAANSVSKNGISKNSIDDDSSVSGNVIELTDADVLEALSTRTIRLVNNKSCVVTYINEGIDDDLSVGSQQITVLIEGIGNFTGSIAVTDDVKVVPGQKTLIEKEKQIRKDRELSRKREIHSRLRR